MEHQEHDTHKTVPPSPHPVPQVIHVVRPLDPPDVTLSPEQKRRHEESRARFPMLNLSQGEFVISAIRRHPIGLLRIWGVMGAAIIMVLAVPVFYATYLEGLSDTMATAEPAMLPSTVTVSIFALLLIILLALGGLIATIVYNGNRFFLTNESVVQEIQTSLFSRKEQTISLTNIEDASFRQTGIIQMLLNYGSLRLSTQGEETTYRFNYVANPREQVAKLNNAVEAFKNGRPVEDN